MEILADDVLGALHRDEVVPVFQPIVEIRTGELMGFEVLARWDHPKHGLILPPQFIGLVVEHGFIGQLTCQVFLKAFCVGALLPAPLFLSVNISPKQLRDLSLPGQIKRMAVSKGFPMDRLIVEVTESALMEDLETAQAIARELKAMGCRLALDDFGIGFSSLSHLHELPFDVLKIDRSFVHTMSRKRQSRKIVAATTGLAHSLCLISVAEGIETREQAEILLRLGSSYGQGWLYGRPQPAARIPEMIAAKPVSVAVKSFTEDEISNGFALESLPTLRLAQLQAIYDGAPVGLCLLDHNLRYVSINQRLALFNGNPVSAHLGRSVKAMYPELFCSVEPYLLRALRGEAISGMTLRRPGIGPCTEPRRFTVSYQPVWDEAQEVVGVSIAVVEVDVPLTPNVDFLHLPKVPSHAQLHFQSVWRQTSFGEN